jgi:hypothetical protein
MVLLDLLAEKAKMPQRTVGNRSGQALALLVVLLIALPASCSTRDEPAPPETQPAPRLSSDGPYVRDDPGGIVTDVSWLTREQIPEVVRPIARDAPSAALVETSEPSRLHVAVRGASCYPHVWLGVTGGPAALELAVYVSKAILPPGIQCGDLLLTHVFEANLSTPVDLDSVVLTASGTADR